MIWPPALLPLQQDVDLEQEVGALEAAKSNAVLYEALVTSFIWFKDVGFYGRCLPLVAGSVYLSLVSC